MPIIFQCILQVLFCREVCWQFVDSLQKLRKCLFGINIPCDITRACSLECSAFLICEGVSHDDFLAYFIQGREGIAVSNRNGQGERVGRLAK